MTRSKRFFEVLSGILMFAVGLMVLFIDEKYSFLIMLVLLQVSMTLRGFGTLLYYLSMARYMAGGKNVLYRSFIFLELGVLGGSIAGHEMLYAVIYLAVIHAFAGAVSVLRANESRGYGGRWRLKMTYGLTNILLAAAVIVSYAVYNQKLVTIYIYGAGLMYSAILQIVSALKRTKIVYIQ